MFNYYKKSARSILGLLTLLLFPPIVLADFNLDQLPKEVPLSNSYYSIRNVKSAREPGILKFEVFSPHTIYEVEGVMPLVKILKEIEIIERVKQQDHDGFFSGAGDSVEATAVGLGNLVVHPVDSAKGLGKAAGKLGRSVGGVFRKKEAGERSSLGEKMLGSSQREVAQKIGADVYTRNPNLKNLIDQIANARMGGRGAVMVISFLIPVAAIASFAMSAGSLNSAADKLVNDTDRVELYRLNRDALLAIGYQEVSVTRFLNRADLTPREQTYFRFYMDALKRIEGASSVFEGMINASSGWDVMRKLYEAQMLAGGHLGQFAKIWSYPEGTAVLEMSGRIMFFAAYDHLESDDLGMRVLSRVQYLTAQNHAPAEICNGGFVTEHFKAQAHRQKISVKSWCYFDNKVKHEKI